jgi:hypothetical protein
MSPTSLSPEAQQTVLLALRWWSDHWDWECPTLFGLELAELNEVIASWPQVDSASSQKAALAATGAMRELLLGASAVSKQDLPVILGQSYERALGVHSEVHAFATAVLDGQA